MATSSTTSRPPTPERIFDTLLGYQQAAALRAALDLDIFTAIGKGAVSIAPLAVQTKASERGVRILCDYLVVRGFLTKNGSEYGLTQESAVFLDQRSPAYIGGMRHFLHLPEMLKSAEALTETVRTGTTQLPGHGSVEPDNPIWVDFARSMAAMVAPAAQGIAQLLAPQPPRRVLDIAAGHGLFGITLAQKFPEAKIVALDWAAVLAVAQENARKAGVEARYSQLPGSAFEADFGKDYDVVLVTNFFHHFDPATCEQLMKKIYSALAPGGRCVTLEFVPNDDRVSPPIAATFPMTMLASTPSGDAYTFAEYERMFRAAGFAKNEIHEVPMSPEHVIISSR
jgi:SAM-dependent methyltransferase